MKKKILSALLVGAMVSSLLAGCGGSDSATAQAQEAQMRRQQSRALLMQQQRHLESKEKQ